jgi:hypothetical protein
MFERFHAPHPKAPNTMPAIQVQAPPLAIDPATPSTLLQTIVDTMPYLPNSSEAERAAQRDCAFALIAALDPRNPVQAMLVAHIIAAHHACMHAYRCAALPEMPPALHLRYQVKAAALSRVTIARLRELKRLQAEGVVAVAAGGAGPGVAQVGGTASGGLVRQATQAARPESAAAGPLPGIAVAGNSATGAEASPGDAGVDQLLAEVAARLAAAGIKLAA